MNNDIFNNRIKKLKAVMQEKNLDILLLTKDVNKTYYSGFKSTSFYLLLTRDEDFLLTDFRYIEDAQEKSSLYSIIELSADATLYDFLKPFRGAKCGFEEKDLRVADYEKLLYSFGRENMIPFQEHVELQRMIKDRYECACIESAAKIADDAFAHILNFIQKDRTEKEVALELEMHMRKSGADGLSFDTIVASGIHSSKPHAHLTDKPIEHGDFITMDFGCMVNGYCSDMTRTIALGAISEEQEKVYEIVKKAQIKALESISAGKITSEVDNIARSMIKYDGYGSNFGHGLGHSVGLEVHEEPRLSPTCTISLEENMVVTVEPGIYLPQRFGVRIEDLVIVKKDGIINLTKSDKNLTIL
ncbi:MAG: aminopeptidase P family protein [Peptostreptococcales bacterium]